MLLNKYLAIGTVVTVSALGGYTWYLTNQRDAALERIGRVETQLEQALKVNQENEEAVDMLQNTIRAQAAELRGLAERNAAADRQVRNMQTLLRNISIDDLATQNPVMLQDEINRRTAEFIEEINRETSNFNSN